MSKYSANGILIIALVLIFGVAYPVAGSTPKDPAKSLEAVYQRIIRVGLSFLKYQEKIIFRLKNDKPVDVELVSARFSSASQQIKLLRRIGKYLENKIPPSDASLSTINGLKAKLPMLLDLHQKNMVKIKILAGESFDEAAELFDDSINKSVESSVDRLFIKKIDDAF